MPDWSAGVKVGVKDGVYFVVDVKRVRGRPLAIKQLVRQTAKTDGVGVMVRMEQEPGSSGVNTVDDYARTVLMGYDFRGVRSTGDKVQRANPVSSAAEAGNVKLVQGPWIPDYLDELEAFPTKGAHDDQVDGTSGAVADLNNDDGEDFVV